MHSLCFFRTLIFLLFVSGPLLYPSPLLAVDSVGKTTILAPLWKRDSLTVAMVKESQAEIKSELEAIGTDTPKDAMVGQKKALLKRELELLDELEKILERNWQLDENNKTRKQRKATLTKNLKLERSRPAPSSPKNPTLEEFETIKETLALQDSTIKAITEEFGNSSKLLQQIPQHILTAKEQLESANRAAQKLLELKEPTANIEKRLLKHQIDNFQLEARVSQELINLWEKELEDEKNAAPLRELAMELARLQYEATEQKFSLYQEQLKNSQERELKKAEDQLAKKQHAVEVAATPQELVLATWESYIAQLQNNIADLKRGKTNLLSSISDQEKQLNIEKDDLKSLKNLVDQVGSSGPAAEILKTSFQRVGQSRQELASVISREFHLQQRNYQTRRIELDSQLRGLREKWEADFSTPMAALKGNKQQSFKRQGTALLNQAMTLLRTEKHLIFDLITEGQRFLLLPIEREEALNDLESFVLSRVFWIQDATPIGLPMLSQLFSEIGGQNRNNSLWNWWKKVLSIETISGVLRILKSWTAIIYGGLIFFVVPLVLYLLRVRLYKFVAEQSRRGREDKEDIVSRLPIVLASLAGSLLNPIFFLLAAPMVATLDLPVSLGPILSSFLVYVALFLFVWLLSSSFFSKQGVAVSLFGVSQGVAQQFLTSFRLVLITYLACMVPWLIFPEEPFLFEAFPRIGFLVFEAGVFLALYKLIRPGSPLIKQIFANSQLPDAKPSRQERYWVAVNRIAGVFMVSVLVLDGAGYHFGATYLSINGLWSLLTILLLATTSRVSAIAIRTFSARSRRQKVNLSENKEVTEHQIYMLKNLFQLWQIVLAGIGLYLITQFWGLNESALKAITDTTLFQTTSGDGQVVFVTTADLLISTTIFFLSLWILRNLTGIYEAVLFPFVKFDDGLRYAVITISRYLVFIICAVWITSVLQVDLSKVGWVVAAMSVGLGFGLQEIVANFVSGIILLIERPIRVGDMVSIGTENYGQVTQVNIRSTTILNRDRLEVLVPNKDLISKEVINWTLSDSVIRQKLNIGVAYGSDVEKVRSILLSIAAADPDILADPPSKALFLNHGDSSLDFEIRFFLNDPLLRRVVADRLNTAINREFAIHNIEIPFPQRDLHIIPREAEKTELATKHTI
ncbi:MAG: mechanosensitive ion channel [Magnetococcales bacterium]|nr:mechanosensitive ion channel [Magnetococcales bacterium]